MNENSLEQHNFNVIHVYKGVVSNKDIFNFLTFTMHWQWEGNLNYKVEC
jgi:hypothetical protein